MSLWVLPLPCGRSSVWDTEALIAAEKAELLLPGQQRPPTEGTGRALVTEPVHTLGGAGTASGPRELTHGPVGQALCLDTALPCTCLVLEFPAPPGWDREGTCLPGYKEAEQLQVHVHSNVQEGGILNEGVFFEAGEEAEGETRCQMTPSRR